MNTKYKSLLASIIGAVFVIAFSVVLCATECLYSVDDKIKELRTKLGITQKELAEK